MILWVVSRETGLEEGKKRCTATNDKGGPDALEHRNLASPSPPDHLLVNAAGPTSSVLLPPCIWLHDKWKEEHSKAYGRWMRDWVPQVFNIANSKGLKLKSFRRHAMFSDTMESPWGFCKEFEVLSTKMHRVRISILKLHSSLLIDFLIP